MGRIIVSLLNYNRGASVLRCIERTATSFVTAEFNIVFSVGEHSASEDLTPQIDQLRACGHAIDYRIDRSNPGFGAGHNRNFARSALTDDDIFIVMNDDFAVNLYEFLVASKRLLQAGEIVTCRILNFDGGIWFIGGNISKLTGDIKPWRKMPEDGEVATTDYVTGCMLACRVGIFRRVGGFPENYFMYSEDTAFSRKARQLGIPLRVTPFLGTHEAGSGYDGNYASHYLYFGTRNRILEFRSQPLGIAWLKPLYAFGYLGIGRIVQLAIKWKLSLPALKSVLAGLRDGLKSEPETLADFSL